jgi:ribosome-binding factor A
MSGGHRIERLQELFKEEISKMLMDGRVKDPRVGFVTITRVEVTKDLSYASVYFSVMGDEAKKEESLAALGHAAKFIQGQIAKEIRVRKVPQLRFKLDRGLEHSLKIGEIIRKIHGEE